MIYEENDEIVVTELRRVDDIKRSCKSILISFKSNPEILEEGIYYNNKFQVMAEDCFIKFDDDEIEGWLPMPVYKSK